MSTTRLWIKLAPGPWPGDQYEHCYAVGGEVTGELILKSPDGQRATNVAVELEWETSGRGTRDHKIVHKEILHEGDIPALADMQLPFKLLVPGEGPITYHGQLINVNWKITARIDIKWAIDQTEETRLSVLPTYDQV